MQDPHRFNLRAWLLVLDRLRAATPSAQPGPPTAIA
jgi:hypothetical protein